MKIIETNSPKKNPEFSKLEKILVSVGICLIATAACVYSWPLMNNDIINKIAVVIVGVNGIIMVLVSLSKHFTYENEYFIRMQSDDSNIQEKNKTGPFDAIGYVVSFFCGFMAIAFFTAGTYLILNGIIGIRQFIGVITMSCSKTLIAIIIYPNSKVGKRFLESKDGRRYLMLIFGLFVLITLVTQLFNR